MNENSIYVFKNVFIVCFLLNAFLWSLTSTNNIFQKILALKFVRSSIIYMGLWHSWNMFVDPYRINSILYANIHFKDGLEIMQEIYHPKKGLFLGGKRSIRDVKYIENILTDKTNLRNGFMDYLISFYTNQYRKTIKQLYIVQEYGVVGDFFSKNKSNTGPVKIKFICGSPKNDISKSDK